MHTHRHRNIIFIGIISLAIVVSATILLLSRHAPAYATATVARGDISSIVRANGTVTADQSSTLSFSAQGKIDSVRVEEGDVVHKGDILATLDTSTTQAELDSALADVATAQAQLSKLEEGARPEELALYSQKYSDASAALLVAMNDAYQQTYDAITNKADSLFTNGNTVNPVIAIFTQNGATQLAIDTERISLSAALSRWNQTLATAAATDSGTSTIEAARAMTQSALAQAQAYLNDLSAITNYLSPGNSGLTPATITADVEVVSGANQEVTSAANAFTSADASWSAAEDSLALENAGAQSQDIAAAEAALAKARAEAEGYQSALEQSSIVAPFDGTITGVDVKVGEVVVPGLSVGEDIGIIGTDLYNIDVYVPENAIGSIAAGDSASITFDAYGSSAVFPATVYLVDPAETVIDGADSYKVRLRLDEPDARVRSGLTANAVITTATATDALVVPTRAIITKDDRKFVLKQSSNGAFVEQAIETGIVGSNGFTQIISGLDQGDVIASFGAGDTGIGPNY
jgi:HlyD family secretion protein